MRSVCQPAVAASLGEAELDVRPRLRVSVAWADGLARIPAGRDVAVGDSLEFYSMDALLR